MSIAEQYSGLVINQNQQPAVLVVGTDYYQTFGLPSDLPRGEDSSDIPDITGVQFLVDVVSGAALTASIVIRLDRYDGARWSPLASAQATNAEYDGMTWFGVFFDEPVKIKPSWLSSLFRAKITLTTDIGGIYYSYVNPMTIGQAFTADDAPLHSGNDVSLLFRVFGAVADSGVDFLGDIYREVAHELTVANLGEANSFWLSKPNPSQFAVESLYFDYSVNGEPVVIDAVTVTPITPGVKFHIYYSNDPVDPGSTVQSWDHLLWVPVAKTYTATRKDTYTLPEPIVAKFLKVEFSMLQPRPYDPGPHAQAMVYQKHPKWVLSYFLNKFGSQDRDFISSGIDITYDAHDLAFTYYQDDVIHEPDPPSVLLDASFDVNQETGVDPATLSKIVVNYQPYQFPPLNRVDQSSILGGLVAAQATNNYSTEALDTAFGNTSVVSNTHREALLVEKGIDPMHFYFPCRHSYRVAQASFRKNIAYFAGVSEVVFHRHIYSAGYDYKQFNEVLADGQQLAFDYQIPPALRPLSGT